MDLDRRSGPDDTGDQQQTERGNSSCPSFVELDRGSVTADVRGDDGEVVPAGSLGTIVAVWRGGEAFEVEFTKPVHALATVDARVVKAALSERC